MNNCGWPALAEPHASALREAVAYVVERFQPNAIVAAGSVLRGAGGPTSDLDLYVIRRGDERQRVSRRFAGVPVEIFVNPPEQVRRYLPAEAAAGRPITAHILTTGVLVYRDGDTADLDGLRSEAADLLARGPEIAPESLALKRYLVADLFDDATDVVESDPDAAMLLLDRVVEEAIRCLFWARHRWQPKGKNLLGMLDEVDPAIARLARAFTQVSVVGGRHDLAREIVRRCVGAVGFIEWETTPERVL